jgi:sec-independent protein translocase protein TatA
VRAGTPERDRGGNTNPALKRTDDMMTDLFDSPWKILIIAVVIIVLFGSKKLPHAARSLGQSMRILKTEVEGLHEEDPDAPAAAAQPAAALTAGQPDQRTEIAALQQQIRDLQRAAVMDAVPITPAAATPDAMASHGTSQPG